MCSSSYIGNEDNNDWNYNLINRSEKGSFLNSKNYDYHGIFNLWKLAEQTLWKLTLFTPPMRIIQMFVVLMSIE